MGQGTPIIWKCGVFPETLFCKFLWNLSLLAELVLSRWPAQRVTRAGMTPAAVVCVPIRHTVRVANGDKHIRNLLHNGQYIQYVFMLNSHHTHPSLEKVN